MENEIMVSIICTAYNHENYIEEALDSFIMQKVNFNIEILIHDDASTDKTADIIKNYESKYPDLIKPIYQSENQYSKGVKIDILNEKRAIGKYITICEGDDFWTDPYKLQKQVDYMESHPECSMCVHAAFLVSPEGEKLTTNVRPNNGNKVFSVEEVIEGGGALFPTNSTMYRRTLGIHRPDFYINAPFGDYPLAINMALQGTVYYIDEFMSAYRVNVKGSWTQRSSNNEKMITLYNDVIKMLEEINIYTDYKYNTVIEKTIKRNQFFKLLEQNLIQEAKKPEYKEYYSTLGLSSKFKINIKLYAPWLAKLIITIKRKYVR